MPSYTVTPIANLWVSTNRGLAFLESSDSADELNARLVFEALPEKKQDMVRSRFDHWLQGNKHDKYFHGWPNNPTYKDCFVFKWKDKRQHQRLYGFLTHPRPLTAAWFMACILVSHAQKNREETDPSELNGANRLRIDAAVIKAVRLAYPEQF